MSDRDDKKWRRRAEELERELKKLKLDVPAEIRDNVVWRLEHMKFDPRLVERNAVLDEAIEIVKELIK